MACSLGPERLASAGRELELVITPVESSAASEGGHTHHADPSRLLGFCAQLVLDVLKTDGVR